MRRLISPPIATAALAAGLALIPAAAASAAVPQVEQVNRGTGPAGEFSLIQGPTLPAPAAISNDGRFAAFGTEREFTAPPGDTIYASPGFGLFARDLVSNRTTRLSSTSGVITGLDRSERILSFITKDAIDPTDRNGVADLYLYERTTGLRLLVSRQGLFGPALGVTSEGAVANGSRYAVFGTATGVLRRDLLTGRTTRLSGGRLGDAIDPNLAFPVGPSVADDRISADGRVAATSEGIVTPTGTRPLPVGEDGLPVRAIITRSGTTAIYQEAPGVLASTRLLNTATGQVTTPPLPAAYTDRLGGVVQRLQDGNATVAVTSFSFFPTITPYLDAWNLETGAVAPIAVPFGTQPSRNGRYGLGVTGSSNGVLVALAAAGSSLPGSIEVPSPNAYLELTDVCSTGETGTPGRRYTVTPTISQLLPLATTVRVRATRPNGSVLADQTLAVPTIDSEGPADRLDVPVGNGAFRVDVTVKLADGRTATERTTRPALPAGQVCLPGTGE